MNEGGRDSRLIRSARFALPLSLLLVGYALVVSGRWTIDHELQLIAPDAVRPSDRIPLRAFLFQGIDEPDGGGLAPDATVRIFLEEDGRALASAVLEVDALGSFAGELSLPEDARSSTLRLRATASLEGEAVATVSRELRVDRVAAVAPLSGRLLEPPGQVVQSPLSDEDSARGPGFELRVAGGACVPEEPCELLLGAPWAESATAEEEGSTATFVASSSAEAGLLQMQVVPHGPGASFDLKVRRRGGGFSGRNIRLPVALATPWIDAPRQAAPENSIELEAHAPPGRGALILDLFHQGHWVRTQAVEPGATSIRLDTAGLWRLQVRADPFSVERSAVRYVVVGSPMAEVHRLLEAEEFISEDARDLNPQLLLAGAEEEVRTLPRAASGLLEDQRRMQERRRQVQVVAALAFLVGIAVFATSMMRRGFRAADEAADVMAEAGDEFATTPRARRMQAGVVIAMVLSVAVALLAGLTLLMARSMLDGQ